MDWMWFALALLAFLLSHAVPVQPRVRRLLVRWMGEAGFLVAYSGLSILVLGWLIAMADRAPVVPLWSFPSGQARLALVLMAPACGLIALSIGRPNPLSFGGSRNVAFDAQDPGIVRLTRHPLLVALALWASAHLVANGNLAHVLMFGTFAGFATFGGRLIDRRRQRELGDAWGRLVTEIRAQPLVSVLSRGSRQGVVRLLCAACLYLLLIWLHPLVLGVSPIP